MEPPVRPASQNRINDQIRAPKVRLVDENGGQVGIKQTAEALEYATNGFDVSSEIGNRDAVVTDSFVEAVEAAFALEDLASVDALLGRVTPQRLRVLEVDARQIGAVGFAGVGAGTEMDHRIYGRFRLLEPGV